MGDDDLFAEDSDVLFAPEEAGHDAEASRPAWRILVVDDDDQVHAVTRLALKRVNFRQRPLEILSAYSAREAEAMLRRESDIALAILDVVMETDDAGLQLARRIRTDLRNRAVRLVLRTGQPGQAPEERVIVDYDINDYKAKTELTATGLFTTVIASLRAYSDITDIESGRRGLQRLIEGMDARLGQGDMRSLAGLMLDQAAQILNAAPDGLVCLREDDAGGDAPWQPLASGGRCTALQDGACLQDPAVIADLAEACRRRDSVFGDRAATLHMAVSQSVEAVAWIDAGRPLAETDRQLLDVLAGSMATAFGNVLLFQKLKETADALRAANEGLEQRVSERTRDLEAANVRLEELASRDSLTGTLNRRALLVQAAAEFDRSRRYNGGFSILIFDLDHFKRINDTYGHLVGDVVIRTAVERAGRALRVTDHLGRYGGEEFVVLLPETGSEGAMAVAERIRSSIADDPMRHEGLALAVTASIGAAVWLPPEESLESLLNRADTALYAAKQAGRNRCVLAS